MYFLEVLTQQQLTIKPGGVALTIISVKISIKSVVRTTHCDTMIGLPKMANFGNCKVFSYAQVTTIWAKQNT